MKRTGIVASLLGVTALLTGGCANQSSMRAHQEYSLGTLGAAEMDPSGPQQPGVFRLGAGDALGQAIFANYVAVAHTNSQWRYAGAETTE
jgi:hypothetical protein